MKNAISFYDLYINTDSKKEQAKAIVELFDVDALVKTYELKSLEDKLMLVIRGVDQKIDLQTSNLDKSIKSLSHVMFGACGVIFAALAYLIFKI